MNRVPLSGFISHRETSQRYTNAADVPVSPTSPQSVISATSDASVMIELLEREDRPFGQAIMD
ncbi:MAG: hypothetical protein R3338_04390 [Thermoanaerobaculia bacterium]|nr:hypothetical protein [Thermoanaerobaculia bacterium]